MTIGLRAAAERRPHGRRVRGATVSLTEDLPDFNDSEAMHAVHAREWS
jgi:hypothetical protein